MFCSIMFCSVEWSRRTLTDKMQKKKGSKVAVKSGFLVARRFIEFVAVVETRQPRYGVCMFSPGGGCLSPGMPYNGSRSLRRFCGGWKCFFPVSWWRPVGS